MDLNLIIYCLLASLLIYTVFEKLDPQGVVARSDCRVGYVYDGDTVEMICGEVKQTARLVGFDTPETKSPGCAMELALGKRATQRLRALVANGDVDMTGLGHDRYGRDLVRMTINGQDVAEILINEGLAVSYTGGSRLNWCDRLGE